MKKMNHIKTIFIWILITSLRTVAYYFILWPYINPVIARGLSVLIVIVLEYFGFSIVTKYMRFTQGEERIFTVSSFNVALFLSAFLFCNH